MTGPAPTASSALLERYDRALLGVFGTPRTVLTHGEGCYVWDADGARYLDLLAGIAVNVLGHAHPAVVAAVSAQAARLVHVSNFFTTTRAGRAGRAAARGGRRAVRLGGLLRQLRHRGGRGRGQAGPPDRPHPHRRRRGRASTAAPRVPSR